MSDIVTKAHYESAALLKLYGIANTHGSEQSIAQVAQSFNFDVPYLRVKLALEALYDQGCVAMEYVGATAFFVITNEGLKQVEYELRKPETFTYKLFHLGDGLIFNEAVVPASDRSVGLDHNSPEVRQIVEDTRSFETQFLNANDFGNLSDDEVKAAAIEVRLIHQAFEADVIRPSMVYQRAKSTLEWIGSKAAEAVIGAAAIALLALIAAFFGISS